MISHMEQISEKNTKETWYISFSVSNSLYAVELSFVFRIIAIDQIHPVSEAAEYTLGKIKVDNTAWTVTDLRMKFGEKNPKYSRHPMGILLEYKEKKRCILIDDVRSVFATDSGSMTPPFWKNRYISGSMQIEDRIVNFLSIDSLFD